MPTSAVWSWKPPGSPDQGRNGEQCGGVRVKALDGIEDRVTLRLRRRLRCFIDHKAVWLIAQVLQEAREPRVRGRMAGMSSGIHTSSRHGPGDDGHVRAHRVQGDSRGMPGQAAVTTCSKNQVGRRSVWGVQSSHQVGQRRGDAILIFHQHRLPSREAGRSGG